MKLKIIGSLLIISGFAAPYILRVVSPTFLYGAAVSSLFFWVGFLSVLRPLQIYHQCNPYLRWASYAIWFNIALTLTLVLYFYIMIYLDIRKGIGLEIFLFLDLLANPIERIFDRLVPLSNVQQPDGAIRISYSFIRILLITFMNLIFFCILGALAKYFKNKKITNHST